MLTNHPLRERVVQEMLLRRFPAITTPSRIVQIVRIVAAADRDEERRRVMAMPDGSFIEPGSHDRHVAGACPRGALLSWERHSEASTATILLPLGIEACDATAWIEGLPGHVVRAMRITVLADEASAGPVLTAAALAKADLVTCHVGPCRIWSDFRMGNDGYGQMILVANGCPPADLGRIIQRVQELGNYRNLALLGLPLVQQHGAGLDRLEAQLSEEARLIAEGAQDDEALLERLSALSAELEHVAAATAFRLGATNAYAAIVADRLASLDIQAIEGHQSLVDFNDRRFVPAVRTCATFAARIDTLGARTARITALLRTRIETSIERQNRDLLTSVEQGIGLQLRLQHLVESLSVLAISYYAISLLGYVAKGVSKVMPWLSPELLLAMAVLPVSLGIMAFIRHRRGRLFAGDAARHA
ncbi:DUF3422 domain-containing protein [Sphingomonas crocodyli]|uniref:DUF3422 family protein n=1 Tax=Sphingomonas crocodyli TaxID=1979270 RepID=A0A437M634_9SPHN|nr:DUF3422 domain-containing protein [Sphingomonas crocodyli]RVT93025.1 DUF3422 family protein [Sphingomonas crocodyli]